MFQSFTDHMGDLLWRLDLKGSVAHDADGDFLLGDGFPNGPEFPLGRAGALEGDCVGVKLV